MLLNKYSHMRSREENDITSNKLLGVIYVLLHCSLSVPGPDKGFEGAAGTQLGTACSGTALGMEAMISPSDVGMWDPGSLPDVLSTSMAHLISMKASGCLPKAV